MKRSLLEEVGVFLLKHGFTIKNLTRTCFDIIARKETMILLVKVLEDANSIQKEHAEEMIRLSDYVTASPLLIAEKAGEQLLYNAVYRRFGIYTITFSTFRNAINHKYPFIFRTKAGFTAAIKGQRMKELREQEGLSINAVSKRLGVSRRMISKYESDVANITLAKAEKMHKVFGDRVFCKIDIFSSKGFVEPSCDAITNKYGELGFDATKTKRVPFDVIAKRDREIVLTEIGDKTSPHLESMSRLLDADRLAIFKKTRPEGIPALTRKEFLDFEKANELIRFLKEY